MIFSKSILLALLCCAGFCGSVRGAILEPESVTQDVGTDTSISQFGITWVCKGTVSTGQYANGDYWVVGPVQIIAITNNFHTNGLLPSIGLEGSMITREPIQSRATTTG